MNTQFQRSMPLPTITNCALTLAGRNVLGLGGEYANGQTHDQPGWPAGMKDLVNAKQRIGGMFVNTEDIFFYSGTASEFERFSGWLRKNPEHRTTSVDFAPGRGVTGRRERKALRLETSGSPRCLPPEIPDGNGVARSGLCVGGSFLDRRPHRAG